MNSAATRYLRIPLEYSQLLDGVSWSDSGDCLLYEDGRLLAFRGEVTQFLLGFSRVRSLIPFGYLVHLLDLLRNSGRTHCDDLLRLRRLCQEHSSSLENLGAFCGHLCEDFPETSGVPTIAEIVDLLKNSQHSFWCLEASTLLQTVLSPLAPWDFRDRLFQRFRACSDADAHSWLEHGRPPLEESAGKNLASQLQFPPTLMGSLASLLQLERLAGAQAFIAQMQSVLILPRRRLTQQDLPMGGYTDIGTRGQLDQILPVQFALEEEDFQRRLAERELLYFRREEPHTQTKQELVLLLDQGVRTWGDVRLLLCAAVLALGKRAVEQKTAFLLADTSGRTGLVDPARLDSKTLGEIVGAADFSPHPGEALERLLEQPSEGDRDIVLLTHPRSLDEEDVRNAARRATGSVRLFAIVVDRLGTGQLVEMRHGTPIPITRFAIDFTQAVAPPVVPDATEQANAWHGDVEPIGFPFRFGVDTPFKDHLYAFDTEGNWFCSVHALGVPRLWNVADGDYEVLPRGMYQGEVFQTPSVVLGVYEGFVLGGYLGDRLLMVRYDLRLRRCKCSELSFGIKQKWLWSYNSKHQVIVLQNVDSSKEIVVSLTGQPFNLPRQYWEKRGVLSRDNREVVHVWNLESGLQPPEVAAPSFIVNSLTGECLFTSCDSALISMAPVADGRPVFQGRRAIEARRRESTLAINTTHPSRPSRFDLFVLRLPEGKVLMELPLNEDARYCLSSNGSRLAFELRDRVVQFQAMGDGNPKLARTRMGGIPQEVRIWYNFQELTISMAKGHTHTIDWRSGQLKMLYLPSGHPNLKLFMERYPAGSDLPNLVRYDRKRFEQHRYEGIHFLVDHWGQIVVLDRHERLICMFFALREHFAAWMPTGVRLGPSFITGGPPTPQVVDIIGRALREATGDETT